MITGLYARLIGAALIVAAIAGGYFYVQHLRGTIEDQRNELAIKEANIKQLNTAIETQNAAVDALKKDADARVAAAEVKVKAAQAETTKAKARADAIFRAKPKDPSDLCKSALDLVNGGVK